MQKAKYTDFSKIIYKYGINMHFHANKKNWNIYTRRYIIKRRLFQSELFFE